MALSRDARLVARVKRGDSSAFEELHARHQPAILAFCRHLTGNREDAEDAVQHTFLAVYRRIVESDDVLELRPWLFAVARNRSLSLLRARRDRVVTNPDAATAFDGLAVEVERRQELRDLVCDMSRLPEPQRAALVLSQLDALSYREIGSVLEVPAEKVKALVFQARSSLASTREAREAPCFEIRSEIATARGSGLRRRLLRRHVGQCDGCREFEVSVLRQRRDLAILLPVAPSAGLGQAILEGALGREGATTTAGAGGAVAGTGGAGLAGTLASLAGGGAAKLAVVAVVAGGSAAGAVAADLPERIQSSAPVGASDRVEAGSHSSAPQAEEGGGTGAGAPRPLPDDGEQGREPGREGPSADGEKGAGRSDATEAPTRDGEIGGENAAGNGVDDGPEDDGAEDAPAVAEDNPADLPPGLAKRDELPPGLAKRDELPPGLAKGRGGDAPGNANGGQGDGVAPGLDGGEQDNVGGGNGNANVDTGAGQGNGNAGGQGNNGGGQGGGNAGGQGNGNGNAGQGNSGGQANGNGNGNGNPH